MSRLTFKWTGKTNFDDETGYFDWRVEPVGLIHLSSKIFYLCLIDDVADDRSVFTSHYFNISKLVLPSSISVTTVFLGTYYSSSVSSPISSQSYTLLSTSSFISPASPVSETASGPSPYVGASTNKSASKPTAIIVGCSLGMFILMLLGILAILKVAKHRKQRSLLQSDLTPSHLAPARSGSRNDQDCAEHVKPVDMATVP